MTAAPDPSPGLAPLQRVMLWDSLANGGIDHHVEQVEIVLTPGLAAGRVVAAWQETVARTAALRIAFLSTNGMPAGVEFVEPVNFLDQAQPAPASWQRWRESDRQRPLLEAHAVPWRAVYWHEARRFIWTFHHALLDGRSIARILQGFVERLNGREADDLALSEWHEPSTAMVVLAAKMFHEMTAIPESAVMEFPPEPEGQAARCLGNDFLKGLESLAAAMEVTAATILTWAWGQALAEASGTGTVLVEQLRAGAPQPGTAGFTMNTLPLVIHRAAPGEMENSLCDLRARLLALREIEAVSPDDFPPGVYPNMDGPGSSVIMIERDTLQHLAGATGLVESLVLHEGKGETLMATAYLLPDLRLEVEGPGKHFLLEAWIDILDRGIHPA